MDIKEFVLMLDSLYNKLELKKVTPKIMLPDPVLIKSGHKTIWKNPDDFLKLFNRKCIDLSNYINSETSNKVYWITDSSKDGCIFDNKTKKDYIFELMKKYVTERILCKSCKSIDTEINKIQELRKYNLKCNNCNNEYII